MVIERIDHVQLAMPRGGEDDARRFYGMLLELPEVPKPPHLAARGGCWFESEHVKIHLGVEQGFRPAKKAHPALVVDDLEALVAKLAASGVEVAAGDERDESRSVYAYDPFGNRLELLQAQR